MKTRKQSKKTYKKDPNDSGKLDHGEGGKPKFGSPGSDSKTMRIAGGKLPPPQKKHVHHQKNSARPKRAK